ncbi:MAG: hypothetical protein QXW01_01770 [Candidatus Aenigmatarchaeota archaeon]
MAGDLTEIEICDICGKEVYYFYTINGLVVCIDCKENLNLEKVEDNSSNVCAICGWPIQRVISKEETKKFVKGVKLWIKKFRFRKKKVFIDFLKKLEREEHYLCRYDFFYLIKEKMETFDKKLSKRFEKEIASQYDFFGSLVS